MIPNATSGVAVPVAANPTASSAPSGSTGAISMEDIERYLSTLTPEEQEQFMSNLFRDFEGETSLANEQKATAAALRGAPGPQGRTMGDIYQAAHPLEHLASGVNQFRGTREQAQAEKLMEDIQKARSQASVDMAKVYR